MRSGFPTGELSVQWRRVSATLVALVVVASCRSDAGDDGPELGLDDGADVEVEPDDASSAEDDADGSSADDDPLYPPLPPLEPDPTSDISIEDQQFFLDLHARVYEVTQGAFATNEVDRQSVEELLAGEALEEFLLTVERRRNDGVVSRSPDGSVAWLEVADLRNGQFSVQECRLAGTRTGLYDEATGEASELFEEPSALIIETLYELVDGSDYRATFVRSGTDALRCDE